MKAIDTNVLVRLIVKDNDIQAKKALNYVKKQGEVLISTIVLCETAWVLEACYDIKKTELINVVEKVLFTTQFIFEHTDVIWLALNEFKRTNTDFTDCLIVATAKQQECQSVGTFDKKASKSELFELIK